MKKDPWVILGIQPTDNTFAIKKAYRGLIRRYHPDTAASPEMVRRNTIKSVEIIEAYQEAMVLAGCVREDVKVKVEATPEEPVSEADKEPKYQRKEWVVRASRRMLIFVVLFIVAYVSGL